MKQLLSYFVVMQMFCIAVYAGEPVTVKPLVKVNWGQYAPYNQFCPELEDGHAAAGCVAVAMAQAISTIDPPVVDINDTTAVAQLIAECGKDSRTTYGKSSTAAMGNQIHGIVDSLGYDPDILIHNREYTTADEWHDIIINELQCGRPVMVSAQDPLYGGHSFVIDGCRNDSVHINWGWTGKENGYYSLDNLNPSIYHFTDNQRILTGFMRNDQTQTIYNQLDAMCKMSDTLLYESTVKGYYRIKLSVSIYNRSYYPFKGYYQIYFVDDQGNMSLAKNGREYILTTLNADCSTSAQVKLTPPTTPGTYHLLIKASQQLVFNLVEMGLAGTTSLTILPGSADGIENPVIDADDTNNGKYYNAAGQRIAKPAGRHLFKRTRQGGQLVI